MIVWSKYRLGLPIPPLHYGLMWPGGIPTIFQTPVTVPLHSPNGRQMPAVRAVKGDCLRVYGGWNILSQSKNFTGASAALLPRHQSNFRVIVLWNLLNETANGFPEAHKFHHFLGSGLMGLLPDTKKCRLRMRWECRERFTPHRGLAIPTCITTRAWHTCQDACRDR